MEQKENNLSTVKASIDGIRITEHLVSGLAFSEWADDLQLLMFITLFPKNPLLDNGEWTEEAKTSLKLIHHLSHHGKPILLSEKLMRFVFKVDYSAGIEDRAKVLRSELLELAPANSLDKALN